MLLDPLEEDFNPPPFPVQVTDFLYIQTQIVRQDNNPISLVIQDLDPTNRICRTPKARPQPNHCISQHRGPCFHGPFLIHFEDASVFSQSSNKPDSRTAVLVELFIICIASVEQI